MKCTLMHKKIAVAEMEMDDVTGSIQKIYTVTVPEHLPVGILVKKGFINRAAMNDWWEDRAIPEERFGVRKALKILDVSNAKILQVRCYGLSLSDQYWLRPEGSGLMWEKINFFEHIFSDDIGDILFDNSEKEAEFDFVSPDNTTDGCLKKRWKIIDGRRCLAKGGSDPFWQQPFNEVIASGIMERLNIPHIPYTVMWSDGIPYSICEDFITADTELISAWRVIQTQKKNNSVSVYQHFVNCCRDLGITNIQSDLDKMIVLDYLIANEDRHLNNFGLLRNAETLEWLGFAPIYDSGTSLGYDKTPAQMRTEWGIICKPFKKHHGEQLKLVTTFDWIDFDRLSDVEEMIVDTLTAGGAKDFIDENRVKAIAFSVKKRTENLKKIAMTDRSLKKEISTEDDVEENIAQDYVSGGK